MKSKGANHRRNSRQAVSRPRANHHRVSLDRAIASHLRFVRSIQMFGRAWPTLFLAFILLGGLFGARQISLAAAASDIKAGIVAIDGELVKRPVQLAAVDKPKSSLAGAQLAQADAAGASAQGSAAAPGGSAEKPGDNFDFFSDKPVTGDDVVVVPPEKSKWVTVGGPIGLVLFMGFTLWLNWVLMPYSPKSVDINLRYFPPAAKRGMAFAVCLFGVAFAFGASEIWYQMQFYGSSDAFFAQMSLGKLIVMTHAHLFGFTTAFFIVGIPFSMQFNNLYIYQWVLPVGLSASFIDVLSWWGIKYLSPNYEYVSMLCGILFSVSYLWMLIGLLRVLLFPEVVWKSDKDRIERLERIMTARKLRHKRRNEKYFGDMGA